MNVAPDGSCVPKADGGATKAQCESKADAVRNEGADKMKEVCQNDDAPLCEWVLRVRRLCMVNLFLPRRN